MGDLSKHFSRSEFACKGVDCCGGVAPISERLIAALEALRELACLEFPDAPVAFFVASGFRCLKHNRTLGSRDSSLHTLGMAADIQPHGLYPHHLALLAEQIPDFAAGGIGVYPTFVHLDVRTGGPARW